MVNSSLDHAFNVVDGDAGSVRIVCGVGDRRSETGPYGR
eukprot:CAMPEP_0184341934 /NCGR_PEP_ID=MMETSP1089-20130417/10545_1 /TAXON_ID=38269 ORGANISM="Gloeochaete wittrockiana, Strain SAG46.84" /NCGR_SAMPLE_ID=MMETSP1089 /ASSEMBLY_ACC=CAM_ASM_000445 /LENGTH=38 /DNA_ID= /DNA_START= /DNA_END= /DNA_ORIENTATION=